MTIGAKQAGLDIVFGVEHDPKLAQVYANNIGDHVTVADLTQTDVTQLPYVDVFHASPPCTNASVANANAGESPLDMALSLAVCKYITAKRPLTFTLENVYMYRKFESWYQIARCLLDNGYAYNYWHVNMANYGVPQTRKRMIVVARRDVKTPLLPEQTHEENPQPGLFGEKPRWVSWYEAIEDLVPTLPDSEFTPRQLVRLPDEYKTLLMNTKEMGSEWGELWVNQQSPARCVTASAQFKAFIADGQNGSHTTIRYHDDPMFTCTSSDKGVSRALVQGRVVKMTPREFARFQSFPDWYELPESKTLAIKGLGNAVPPLFSRQLYETII